MLSFRFSIRRVTATVTRTSLNGPLHKMKMAKRKAVTIATSTAAPIVTVTIDTVTIGTVTIGTVTNDTVTNDAVTNDTVTYDTVKTIGGSMTSSATTIKDETNHSNATGSEHPLRIRLLLLRFSF